MSQWYSRRALIVVAAALLAVLLTPVGAASAQSSGSSHHGYSYGERTYLVTIENLTAGQPFTPPVVATHNRRTSVWQLGEQASPGIMAVAENGDVPALVSELEANHRINNVSVIDEDGPVLPGGSVSFELTSERDARRLSVASMLICTNDGFTGVDSLRLPSRGGVPTEVYLNGYDAGSELNTESFDDIVPPCGPLSGVDSSGRGTGMSNPDLAEGGVITVHPTIDGTGDLVPDVHDWVDPVAKITITRIDNAARYDVTVRNNSAGQPFTPPVFSTHRRSFDLFEVGKAASAGVSGVAENGDVPGLVAELADSNGVVTVDTAAGPVVAGEETTFSVYTRRGVRRFSIASMLICTNDGFTGLSNHRLPRWVGDSVSFDANSYDAGTELNTELFADLVPPCGPLTGVDSGGQGTGMSNPDLAEGGVVIRHNFLEGNGDLVADIHDWVDPVADVTITRTQ